MSPSLTPISALLLMAFSYCHGQNIQWQFAASSAEKKEIIITVKATIKKGWHLYSQFANDDGPTPTQFLLQDGSREIPLPFHEQGFQTRFYDSNFETEIVCYDDTVTFTKGLTLSDPTAPIHGRVLYMMCNDHVCIPEEQTFTIPIQ